MTTIATDLTVLHDTPASGEGRGNTGLALSGVQAAGSVLENGVLAGLERADFPAEPSGLVEESTSTAMYEAAKRAKDIILSSVAILLLSPLFLLIAAVIKLSDGGPVFFVHRRVGYRGREFTCYKFRSMVVDAEAKKSQLQSQSHHSDSRTFKIAKDPRVTWFGNFLRRSSLDELPQLFNVLNGTMSLVGPRPAVPSEVAQYTIDDMRRLEVKPGITCIWQVSGRSNLPFPKQLELDVEYIERRSLGLDLALLARTVPAVVSGDGAY